MAIIGILGTDPTLSGLYIDDTTAGRLPVNQAFYSDQDDYLDGLVEDAEREALRRLRIAVSDRLTKNYNEQRVTVGYKNDYSGGLAGSEYKFMCIHSKLRGATLVLNEVNIFLTTGAYTGQFWIYKDGSVIYTNYEDDAIVAFTQQVIDLDETIYIVYRSASVDPRNFKHTGCCGKTQNYNQMISVGSGTVTSVDDLEFLSSNYCQGIELKGYIDCDGFKFIDELNYETNVFGIVYAKLIQQIARYNMGYWILTNDKVTPYAMVKAEELSVIMEYLKQDIDTMLKFLPENYDHSDCYICSGMYKSEILI